MAIPNSFPWSQGCQMVKFAPTPSTLAQSKERKGSNFAAQHSGAIVQKPEGPNTWDLKIWLQPPGNYDLATWQLPDGDVTDSE